MEPDVVPETSAAPASREQEALAEQVAALVAPGRGELAATLARAALRHLTATPPDPAERLAQLFGLLEQRSSARLAVRVSTPEVATHGYATSGSVIEVCVEDRPFLLTSLNELLRARGITAAVVLHPVVGVERGPQGQVLDVTRAREADARQAVLHIELDVRLEAQAAAELRGDLLATLDDVLVVTGDFTRMRARVEDSAYSLRAAAGPAYGTEEVDETDALLQWLLDRRMVLLGSAVYEAVPGDPHRVTLRPGSGLGIMREAKPGPPEPARVPLSGLVAVSRTRQTSTVHRRARITCVSVRLVDEFGANVGEERIFGLFTLRAYGEAASATPVLRRMLRSFLEKEDIVDRSFDERSLRAAFNAFPKHELFAMDPDALRATLMKVLASRQLPGPQVIGTVTAERDVLGLLVALPREDYSTKTARGIGELLVERFRARSVDFHLDLDDHGHALLLYELFIPDVSPEVYEEAHFEQLQRLVAGAVHGLREGLVEELRTTLSTVEATQLANAFLTHAPRGYLERTDPVTASLDLAQIRALHGSKGPGVRIALRRAPSAPAGRYRLRVYRTGPAVELSAFLPVLESLGLTVTDQESHTFQATVQHRYRIPGPSELQRADRAPGNGLFGRSGVTIQDFGVRADQYLHGSVALDVERDGPRLSDAALAVLRGQIEADSLNRLVLTAGLRWDDVEMLRAYRHYRRQVGTTFTPGFHDDALVANPQVAAGLVRLFRARFDPAEPDPETAEKQARDAVAGALNAVDNFDEDRILRGILGLIDATVRTNRYAATRRDCLSLKFDSARVPDMPKPAPAVEVFVVGPAVQGIHLRGGRVARGGLRWSDRREDFRTEVLGLMKAQMTKNAVIVPTGAKGGFVVTRTGLDPLALRDEVRAAYATYVRGLLDLTDNVVDGEVRTPEGVRAHDGEDPYLVVAADRGTATFSDLANQVAAEYDFWLGDAFASGGSHGYDHKAMGITARGAWSAVRRHFRELDVDVQSDRISVVGIGDMSGDVFGNGLLQSRAVRLLAAFDHRHVFLDPDPDPEAAFAERERLFRLPGSSWRDYDPAVLSQGGGVFSRTQREIPLSPQVQAFLRTDAPALSPPELIKAILRAPVDLLWAGGIGTFVRASSERDAEVGDRANDAVRVTANELGARVVGEGGNLAMTQRARIQYARRGGRCNTDAIDNAGGVDTSDREVNLKILLREASDRGELSEEERDELLASVADDVAAAVVRDVDLQCAAISRELPASPQLLDAYEALMTELVESGRLDRRLETLPDSAEMEVRREAEAGLARPELAVLLGYAKVDHVTRLLASDLPDEPWLRDALEAYFPQPVVARFTHLLDGHRLRRELVATIVANDLINRMGITYVSRTAREMGCMAWEVAAAWWAARGVVDADRLWRTIEALGERTTPALQQELGEEVERVVDTITRAYLRQRIGAGVGAVVARDRPAFRALSEAASAVMPPARRADGALRTRRWTDLGIASALAQELSLLRELSVVPDVAVVAEEAGRDVVEVGEVFWQLSETLPLDDLHARLGQVPVHGNWTYWQKRGLADDLRGLRHAVAGAVLELGEPDARNGVTRFLAERAGARERVRVLLAELDRDPGRGLDGLAVVIRALWSLLTTAQRRSIGT